jgi:4-amino-4-deoxy-L-arabinose transferase-like glycosyltransferase
MPEISADFNAVLHSERSWDRVSAGLGKTMIGYLVYLIGTLVGFSLAATSLWAMMHGKNLKTDHIWMFWIGLALLKLSWLLAWALVVGGHFQCLMSSTERHGAKWIIFFCLTCVIMGPALYFLAWFGGMQSSMNWQLGVAGLQKVRFSTLGLGMLVGSAISSGLYLLSFWYYLGVVARCIRSQSAILMVGMNSLVLGSAVAVTAYTVMNAEDLKRDPTLILATLAAWGVVGVYWFVMVGVVKFAIDRTMKMVGNPFDRNAPRPRSRAQFAAH